MARGIQELWNAIEAWYRGNVPDEQIVADFISRSGDAGAMPWDYDASEISIFGAPASEPTLAEVESLLGFPLPSDLRETYLIHDGSEKNWILEFGSLLSLDGVAEQWTMMRDAMVHFEGEVSSPTGPIKPVHWSTGWIPITDNGGGDPVCVDCDPAPGGTVGQIIKFNHEVGPEYVIAPSLHAWLDQLVDDFASGAIVYDECSIFRRITQQ